MTKRLNTEQAAAYLQLSKHTLNTLRSRGKSPKYIKRGGRVFYTEEALDEWDESVSEVRTSTAMG